MCNLTLSQLCSWAESTVILILELKLGRTAQRTVQRGHGSESSGVNHVFSCSKNCRKITKIMHVQAADHPSLNSFLLARRRHSCRCLRILPQHMDGWDVSVGCISKPSWLKRPSWQHKVCHLWARTPPTQTATASGFQELSGPVTQMCPYSTSPGRSSRNRHRSLPTTANLIFTLFPSPHGTTAESQRAGIGSGQVYWGCGELGHFQTEYLQNVYQVL